MDIWVIYDKPLDFPSRYVARKFTLSDGEIVPTTGVIVCKDIEVIRSRLEDEGLVLIPRDVDDKPSVVESWI